MGNVTYYPAQSLAVGTSGLKLVQSADVDFSISRQDVYEFGTFFAVDNIQVEPATANLNFSYALSSGANNHVALGISNMESLVNNINGNTYTLSGAGTLTLQSGLISSFAVEGSVGSIPTVSVSVQSLEVSYAAGSPVFPSNGGTASVAEVIRPDQINITFGGSGFDCRSFSFSIDIPREYVNKLGSLNPIANIMTSPPKVSIEAEVILRSGQNPKFENDTDITVSINCGGIIYSVSGAKLANFTSNTTLDDVQVASISLEAPVKGFNQISIGG